MQRKKSLSATLILSFVLLLVDYQYQMSQRVQYAVNQSVVLPIRYVLGLPYTLYSYIGENLNSYSVLVKLNQNLKTENAQLNALLSQLKSLRRENDQLRQSLDYNQKQTEKLLPAEIVQILFRKNRAILVIDRTAEDGVKLNQVVIDQSGLVGRIVEVFQNNSHVLMLSDQEHYISAYTEGGVHTLVRGQGLGNQLTALYVPRFSGVSEGQMVFSSGLDGIYPALYPIGKITAVENDVISDFSHILLNPVANLQSNLDLYILRSQNDPADQKSTTSDKDS